MSLDFACLQETHVVSVNECNSWFLSYGFLSVVSPGSPHSCGSVILYRPCYTLVNTWIDDNHRFVHAEFERRNVTFRVACLYTPNRNPDRDDFFTSCCSSIDPSVPTLTCGDINSVPDRVMDRRGSNIWDVSRESSAAFLSLFQDCSVIDIWRSLHSSTTAFTWLTPDSIFSSQIDLIGCPYAWIHLVQSCDIVACPFSDHYAVSLIVPIPEPIYRGPGRCKLNISTLKDAAFKAAVSDFWTSWKTKKRSFHSIQKWWDKGKEKLKGLAIEFCFSRSKERNQIRNLLLSLGQHVKSQIDNGHVSSRCL